MESLYSDVSIGSQVQGPWRWTGYDRTTWLGYVHSRLSEPIPVLEKYKPYFSGLYRAE